MKIFKRTLLAIITLPFALVGIVITIMTTFISLFIVPLCLLIDYLKDEPTSLRMALNSWLYFCGIGVIMYFDVIWDIDLESL